ncbi:MAG: M48 family metallopeptidase [Firmicutes bacterium]|nr:M48 family metallopeptidase [Bacillota bacterium]
MVVSMCFEYNNNKYEIIIEKKKIKNMYLKVKEDLKIYISCNRFVTSRQIEKLINDNYDAICKMIDRQAKNKIKSSEFYYLGKRYDIVFSDIFNSIDVSDNKIYVKDKNTLEKWLNNQMKLIFKEELDKCINNFQEKIPKVNLKIRNMKTRWGVCNRSNNNVTLNSNLIRYEINIIDYVIYHELSHFIHPNHSTSFWKHVEKYVPNYKILRNRLKN